MGCDSPRTAFQLRLISVEQGSICAMKLDAAFAGPKEYSRLYHSKRVSGKKLAKMGNDTFLHHTLKDKIPSV